MIKLIVSDMDGTLLNDNKKIDEEIFEILPEMKKRGIRFVVASGRQYPSLKRQFAEHIDDVVIIAENGAFVMDGETELIACPMKKEEIHHCLDVVYRCGGLEPLLCAKGYSYTGSRELMEYLESPKFRYEMRFAEDLYKVEEDIIKVSVIARNGGTSAGWYDKLRPMLDESLNLMTSGEGCLDTGLMSVNKGTAVERLQQMWGITQAETACFGDQYNDIDMLEKAYYSYAMEGAMPKVKEIARFQAGSNNNGGVVRAIRELTGIRRER